MIAIFSVEGRGLSRLRFTHPLNFGPMLNSTVPAKSSHGTILRNVICGVCNNNHAPRMLPRKVTLIRGRTDWSNRQSMDLREAEVAASMPGQTATVFVALAVTGGIPVKRSVGKVMKLPPP